MRFPSLLSLFMLTLAILGCGQTIVRPNIGNTDADQLPAITYPELQAKSAATLQGVDQFWSRATVQINWTDEDGKSRYEDGDGPLIWRNPYDLAWAIGKLGKNRFWIGSDDNQYWFFDLARNEKTAYVGSHELITPRKVNRLPVPVRPERLPLLLGLAPLPPANAFNVTPTVASARGLYVVTVPLDLRVFAVFHIDPVTYRPARVLLRDTRQQPLAESTLENWKPVESEYADAADWVSIPTKITIDIPGRDAIARFTLAELTDDDSRIRDVQFDLPRLQKALRITTTEDLDK